MTRETMNKIILIRNIKKSHWNENKKEKKGL